MKPDFVQPRDLQEIRDGTTHSALIFMELLVALLYNGV